MANAVNEHQAALSAARAAEDAAILADREILATRSPSDPVHQAAFARLVERRHQAEMAAAAAAKVRAGQRYVASVKAYADSVKDATRDAAKAPAGPFTPVQRQFARLLLHSHAYEGIAAVPTQLEATMASLLALVMYGRQLLNDRASPDPALYAQLDAAEAEAWAALIQRSKVVAGEAAA